MDEREALARVVIMANSTLDKTRVILSDYDRGYTDCLKDVLKILERCRK